MLAPWKKAMTNLDSVLKSRDFTFLTKVCLVKAMVFPVVMYACDSWTIKKAEPGQGVWGDYKPKDAKIANNRVPWTARRSN